MTQTLVVVVLFMCAMAGLPWLVRRLQQRREAGSVAAGFGSRVLGAVAVGPHQRVVTVEVGPEHARCWLVLGVTAQNVNCLHVLSAAQATQGGSASSSTADFAVQMKEAVRVAREASHG